jgi:citrate lyase subunit beta/citryl-CoA lyase
MRQRRSLLFVPGDQPRKLERAAAAGADVVVLDLEDAVTADRKHQGRGCVAAALAEVDYGTSERVVRVNSEPGLKERDLEAAVGADALLLPKVESPGDLDDLRLLVGAVLGIEIPIIALVAEAPTGVLQAGSFVARSPGVVAWMWGSEDLAGFTGCAPRQPGEPFVGVLALARDTTVLLAGATGTQAIDTVYPYYRDVDGLRAEAAAAAGAGFAGKAVIHPDQIGPVHEAFTPTEAEVARAQEVLDAFADGAGVASLDGQMLDLPHVRAAQRILSRATG